MTQSSLKGPISLLNTITLEGQDFNIWMLERYKHSAHSRALSTHHQVFLSVCTVSLVSRSNTQVRHVPSPITTWERGERQYTQGWKEAHLKSNPSCTVNSTIPGQFPGSDNALQLCNKLSLGKAEMVHRDSPLFLQLLVTLKLLQNKTLKKNALKLPIRGHFLRG